MPANAGIHDFLYCNEDKSWIPTGDCPRRLTQGPAEQRRDAESSAVTGRTRRRRGDRDFAGFRLVAHARGALLGLGATRRHLVLVAIGPALALLVLAAVPLLPLLSRLVHRVQNAEIVLGVLKIAFRQHPVAARGRVTPKLQIFLEQLLGGAADADVRSAAVEDMIAVERD